MNMSSRAKSKLVDQIEYISVRICLAAIKRFVAETHPVACKTAWGSCRTIMALPKYHLSAMGVNNQERLHTCGESCKL